MTSPPLITITVMEATLTSASTIWTHRTSPVQASCILEWISWGAWMTTRTSPPPPRRQRRCIRRMERSLARVSRVAYLNGYRPKTYFRLQSTTPSSTRADPSPPSRQNQRAPPSPSFPTPRTVVRVSSSHRDWHTHSFPSVPSLPLGPYAAPIAPSHSYAQPRVIPSPYDPSFGFTAAEDNFSLSVDLPPQAHNPPYDQSKLATSRSSDLTSMLTICDPAWHQQQCPRLDAFDSDISPLAGITVCDFAVIANLIHSRNRAGCHPA